MKLHFWLTHFWNHGRILLGAALLLLMGGSIPPASAVGTVLPSGFVETLITNSLFLPSTMTFAPDGRLFVAEQVGRLRIIQNDVLLSTPFISLTVDGAGERGLLGIAFDPDFANNQYIYLYYTVPGPPAHNRVSRFTANGNVVVSGSEMILLDLNNLSGATNHNGGSLHFGPDGKLYIGVGENANGTNAQTTTNLLGKVLRINKDGTIPADNPTTFSPPTTGQNRAIWAMGLRNPFTFNFQPGTGRMFINDVGENTWEEINDGIAGSNYGWPTTEGVTSNPNFRSPLYTYGHNPACAISGGVFYNPQVNQFPADYTGDYFFGDYCGRWIHRYDIATGTAQDFATNTASSLVDLEMDSGGSLYYLARQGGNDGAVFRISYTANLTPPSITANPTSQVVPVGEAVSFTCAAAGSPPLHYQWQKNTVNINGATGTTYTIPSPVVGDSGNYRCHVTNPSGSADSTAASLAVVNGHRPSAQITAPLPTLKYIAGQTIVYSGTASDQEDGTLPPSAYTWQVDFHHEDHIHPFVGAHSGVTSDSLVTPIQSHDSIDIWLRILLTVTDSTNLTSSVFVDIHPQTVRVTLNSIPPGVQINIDGIPGTTPYFRDEVVGVNWNVAALTPKIIGSTSWQFESWSDGGNANHVLVVPAANSTFTATYMSCPIFLPSGTNAAPLRNLFTIATPTLTWARVSFATGYEVRVDNLSDFKKHPEYDNDQIAADTLSITTDPLQDCVYYWQVRAKKADGNWGDWSLIDYFVVDTP